MESGNLSKLALLLLTINVLSSLSLPISSGISFKGVLIHNSRILVALSILGNFSYSHSIKIIQICK